MSDDGRHGLTVIAFIGSVFSPYYAKARRRGMADPANHCALNVVLYGPRGKKWAMTERGRNRVARDPQMLSVGPSALGWDGTALTIRIDEVTVPIPSRLRGTVRLYPSAIVGRVVTLDAAGAHRWQPLAPCARVEVSMDNPSLRWSGAGYLDRNAGDAPLESAFQGWHWSRATVRGGTSVLYDVVRRDGSAFGFGLAFDAAGGVEALAPPPPIALPNTGWRIARVTRADAGATATVAHTLEDTPFYARSLVSTSLRGETVIAMHESLSLERFRAPWVQALLPFRMPRAG